MQDDIDLFLSLRPRAKGEMMPDLAGVHKLSKHEALADLERVVMRLQHTPTIAQQLATNQISAQELNDKSSSASFSKGTGKAAKEKGSKGKDKEAASGSALSGLLQAQSLHSQAEQEQLAFNERRRRLQEKLQAGRELLTAEHAKASTLRVELDHLRNEVLSYEDAIMQAKREIESVKRERREVEMQYNVLRAVMDLQLHKLELSRSDAEATETDLRQRLTQSASENHDLSERLNQLRQLEDEFKLKDAKIEVLTIQNQHGHRKLALYESLSQAISEEGATQEKFLNTFAAVLKRITEETLEPLHDEADSSSSSSSSSATAPHTSSNSLLSSSLFPSSSSSASDSASQLQEHKMSDSTSASTSMLDTQSAAAQSPRSANAPATIYETLADQTSVFGQERLHLTLEAREAIRLFMDRLAKHERQERLARDEVADRVSQLAEHQRSIRSLVTQLDRGTTVSAELNLQIKSLELQLTEEQSKTEASLNTIQLLQKQKSDQQTLLLGYEERMKHFQQLLTAADVRADSANTFLSELLKQWNVLKYGSRQLQDTVNRLKDDMRRLVKERNDALDELHERVARYSQSQLTLSSSSSSPLSSQSSTPSIAPNTPPSLPYQLASSNVDRYWIEKDKKLEIHYKGLSSENATLRENLQKAQDKIVELENNAKLVVTRDEHERALQIVHLRVDDARRVLLDAQQTAEEAVKARLEAESTRAALESAVSQLKAELEEARASSAGSKNNAIKSESSSSSAAVQEQDDERQSKKRRLDSAVAETSSSPSADVTMSSA